MWLFSLACAAYVNNLPSYVQRMWLVFPRMCSVCDNLPSYVQRMWIGFISEAGRAPISTNRHCDLSEDKLSSHLNDLAELGDPTQLVTYLSSVSAFILGLTVLCSLFYARYFRPFSEDCRFFSAVIWQNILQDQEIQFWVFFIKFHLGAIKFDQIGKYRTKSRCHGFRKPF